MKIELIGYYGSDNIIAQSAWTSTSRELTQEKLNRVPKLIEMLWSEGHETPFEKASVHFLVTTDIATHIHLLKHRIASINAESARYKELNDDKYHLPKDWKENETLEYWYDKLDNVSKETNLLYHHCLEDLTPILGRKRAKESARFFKMYNSEITADVMFNMRSFANFLKLRWSEHAQVEVRELAQTMFEHVSSIDGNPFEHTLKMIKP